eukprot:8838980-Alexandrium_andersonii.AAC.1
MGLAPPEAALVADAILPPSWLALPAAAPTATGATPVARVPDLATAPATLPPLLCSPPHCSARGSSAAAPWCAASPALAPECAS